MTGTHSTTQKTSGRMGRRCFLIGASSAGLMTAAGGWAAPALALGGRPTITHGIQTGDVGLTDGVIWARTDRPAQMIVEIATSDRFANARRVVGPAAIEATDYTAKLPLTGLPSGQDLFYRVGFQDLANVNLMGETMVGRFRTASSMRRDISFVWTGDTAGQGWGINTEWGGMRGYETMRAMRPDFMIHSGDTIYADGPISAEVKLPNGNIWRNVTTEETSKVAETLAEFRANYKYNLMDEKVRAFNAEVPVFYQWDDHEVTNNWYPGEIVDERYKERSASLLAARAARAFHEFMPIRANAIEANRVYRNVSYGPQLEIFFLDMRTYRGPNGANRQETRSAETDFLGAAQIRWLKQALLASNATWKVIASDMPIGIVVADGKDAFENGANGDGPVLGREHDIAEVLRFIKHNRIANTVWLTADVHYTAAHYYDPNKAVFQDFDPFWEFVSGPIHAGSYGPGEMDNTFGPEIRYTKNPEGKANLPPTEGLQFFGHVRIDGATNVMTVTLKDIDNRDLWKIDLDPKPVG